MAVKQTAQSMIAQSNVAVESVHCSAVLRNLYAFSVKFLLFLISSWLNALRRDLITVRLRALNQKIVLYHFICCFMKYFHPANQCDDNCRLGYRQ